MRRWSGSPSGRRPRTRAVSGSLRRAGIVPAVTDGLPAAAVRGLEGVWLFCAAPIPFHGRTRDRRSRPASAFRSARRRRRHRPALHMCWKARRLSGTCFMWWLRRQERIANILRRSPAHDNLNIWWQTLATGAMCIERLDKLDDIGLVHWPRKADGVPQGKRLLEDAPGIPVQDVWTDIRPIHNQSKERLGYATQKPVELLERIIRSSSSDGDVVLDPFCGCGTTIHAAQALNRRWVGIDICVNACKIIEERLRSHFDSLWDDVQFIGMPKTRDDAKTLADLDKFRFERWAASLVDCMEANKRQRGDGGIDGRGRFPIRKGQFIDVVSQVKGGGTSPGDVQAFNGARQQAGADLGVFTCFEERVTPRMRDAAVSAGRFMEVPTIQIYTIEDFFEGRKPEMPRAA